MLREEREKKMLRKQNEEQEVPVSNAPKLDPQNFFLKFVNDSDLTVQQNKDSSDKVFSTEHPTYQVDQTVYLRSEYCPDLPLRPEGAGSMTKEEYDAAEEVVFDKYFKSISPDLQTVASEYCQFEQNKNVYRELWRVTERSDAMCIIADCRFPLAHTPVSLFNYLKKNRKAVIVLLNKEDLCPKENVDAWKQFYEKWTKQLGL